MRVVLDTNVLLSALVFPGSKPDEVLACIRHREVDLFLSPFILAELERILIEKFRFTVRETADRVVAIRRMATIIEPTARVAMVVTKDDDNRILECALAARADYLVTGDAKHLLPLRSIDTTVIITPAAFLDRWRGAEHGP